MVLTDRILRSVSTIRRARAVYGWVNSCRHPEGLRTAAHLGVPALGPGIDFMRGVGIEIVLTFFLVIVIFGTAVGIVSARAASFGHARKVSVSPIAIPRGIAIVGSF